MDYMDPIEYLIRSKEQYFGDPLFLLPFEEKETVSFDGIVERVESLLKDIQENIFNKAKAYRDARIYECDNYEEFKEKYYKGYRKANT